MPKSAHGTQILLSSLLQYIAILPQGAFWRALNGGFLALVSASHADQAQLAGV